MSEQNCFQIHVGQGHTICPKLEVHETIMKEATSEKYLGDVIDQTGSVQSTIDNRKK